MRKLCKRLLGMGEDSYYILRSAVVVSCVLLACAIVTFVVSGGLSPDSYGLYYFGMELFRLPQSVLLVAALTSAIAESVVKEGK